MMKYRLFIALTVVLVVIFTWGCSGDSDDNPTDSTANSSSSLDTIAPRLLVMQPVSGSSGVPVNVTIAALFSEEMDSADFNDTTFYLSDGIGAEITYADKWARLRPHQSLQNSHSYTVTLSPLIEDTAGNSLAGQYLWSFTTIASDIIPPEVISTTPVNGATEVALNTNIIVEFSEPMDTATINESSFLVGGGVTGHISYQANSATFNPSENLVRGNTYVVILSTLIKDQAGNQLPENYSWSFTTWPGEEIMPLAIGNLWEYHVIERDTIHVTADYYDTILIVSDTMIDMEQWFIDQKGGLYTNRSDGLWIMGSGIPYLFIKYPAEAGEDYNSYSPYEDYSKKAYVLSTNYPLNIPLGSFVTYRYRQYYTMYGGFYYYYSPGMGMIYHYFELAGTIYITKTLTKVELQ